MSKSKDGLTYQVVYAGDTVIGSSRLGLDLPMDWQVAKMFSISTRNVYEYWKPLWGPVSEIKNEYTEEIWRVESRQNKFNIVVRTYNDGVAFRYELVSAIQDAGKPLPRELTTFNLGEQSTLWSVNGEDHNHGPLKVSKLHQLDDDRLQTPVVFTNNKRYAAIHEAGNMSLASLRLQDARDNQSLKAVRAENRLVSMSNISYPWMAICIGDTPGDLLQSNLILNLNEPASGDFSWVKPGKSTWDWRVLDYQAKDGFTYEQNTATHKRFIDFASENNIQYHLIDADWYGPEFEEKSDPTQAESAINIHEVIRYGEEHGVGIILYLNDLGAKKFGLERVLKTFSQWGVKGIKYGFMADRDQQRVLATYGIVKLCAKYKLLVDFHDHPVPPTGESRTFPNLITREYCAAQADAKRSYLPKTAVSACFINQLAGPLDLTDGWYGLNNADERRKVFEPIPGTVAAETAKLIIFYSGLSVLPDAPEEYLLKEDLFEFIRSLPANYDEIKVLSGEIGKFIVLARRKGNEWFLGALTNEDSREVTVDFSFLDENEKYETNIYQDAISTHYLEEKETYEVSRTTITADSSKTYALAQGGGFSMRLIPIQ